MMVEAKTSKAPLVPPPHGYIFKSHTPIKTSLKYTEESRFLKAYS